MRPAFEVEFYRPSMATDWCTWPEPSRAGKEKKTKKKRKENEESTRGTFAEFPRAVGVEGESFERRKKKETVSLGKEKKTLDLKQHGRYNVVGLVYFFFADVLHRSCSSAVILWGECDARVAADRNGRRCIRMKRNRSVEPKKKEKEKKRKEKRRPFFRRNGTTARVMDRHNTRTVLDNDGRGGKPRKSWKNEIK